MAFVIGKAEKKSVFQPPVQALQLPGPGEYNSGVSMISKYQQCAPFNTSQVKVSTFDIQQTKYGPGTYEPKYFKDLNKIKSNQCYVFASKVERFQTHEQKSPKINHSKQNQLLNKNNSEASYKVELDRNKTETNNLTTIYSSQPSQKIAQRQIYAQKLQRSKSLMSQIREQNRQKRVESIKGKREFIRVILTSSTNTQNVESRYIYRNIKGKTLGPGSYQQVNFKPKLKSVMNWNLDKNNRFKTEPSLSPGPGAYYEQIKEQQQGNENDKPSRNDLLLRGKREKLSASFASTVIRSHMDSLIYNTNIPIKAAILQDRRLKDTRPGPGSYNLNTKNKDKKSFNYGVDNNFGSSDRVIIQMKQPLPGPGSYTVKNIMTKNDCNKIIKDIRTQIFGKKGNLGQNYNNDNSLNRSFLNKSSTDPSFTTTQAQRERKQKRIDKFCSLQQRCFSRLGTMNQEQRFKQEIFYKQQPLPGPGQYHHQKIVSGLSNYQSQKIINSVFKSETDRIAFSASKQAPDVPYYNIIRNDIGFKAEKMRKYIQNLKKINVNKTPFQTGSKRFEQNMSEIGIFAPDQTTKRNPTEFLKYDKNKQESSAFKSGTKRQVFKNESKPGPGDYSIQMKNNGAYESIEKKSFNKHYGLLKFGASSEKKLSHSGGFNGLTRKNSKVKRSIYNETQISNQKKLSQIEINPNDIKVD